MRLPWATTSLGVGAMRRSAAGRPEWPVTLQEPGFAELARDGVIADAPTSEPEPYTSSLSKVVQVACGGDTGGAAARVRLPGGHPLEPVVPLALSPA